MNFRLCVRRVTDLENVYAWRVNVHKMMHKKKRCIQLRYEVLGLNILSERCR